MKRKVAFTLRFDPELYERVKKASRRDGRSVTAFVQEAVAGKLAEKEAESLYQAFSIAGKDASEADVEFAREAQREVLSEDE